MMMYAKAGLMCVGDWVVFIWILQVLLRVATTGNTWPRGTRSLCNVYWELNVDMHVSVNV